MIGSFETSPAPSISPPPCPALRWANAPSRGVCLFESLIGRSLCRSGEARFHWLARVPRVVIPTPRRPGSKATSARSDGGRGERRGGPGCGRCGAGWGVGGWGSGRGAPRRGSLAGRAPGPSPPVAPPGASCGTPCHGRGGRCAGKERTEAPLSSPCREGAGQAGRPLLRRHGRPGGAAPLVEDDRDLPGGAAGLRDRRAGGASGEKGPAIPSATACGRWEL